MARVDAFMICVLLWTTSMPSMAKHGQSSAPDCAFTWLVEGYDSPEASLTASPEAQHNISKHWDHSLHAG